MKFRYWEELLNILREDLGANSVERWFNNVIDVERQQNTLYFKVHSAMQADWMEDRYSEAIKKAVMQITGEELLITFVNEQTIKETSSTNDSPADTVPVAPVQQAPVNYVKFKFSACRQSTHL